MDEMQDSTGHLQDGAALRHRIAEDGYLLFRGLVAQEIATEVANEILLTLEEYGHLAFDGRGDQYAVRPPRENPPDDTTIALQRLEQFHAFGWHPRVRDVARALLGPSAYVQPRKILHTLFPIRLGDDPFPIHRDNIGGPWCRDVLTIWTPFGEVGQDLGGMAILRGSQDYRHGPTGTPVGIQSPRIAIPDDSSPDWVTTEFRSGDVLLFHCYTLHKLLPNRSNQVHLSAEYRWQSTDHPSHVNVMLPHRYFSGYPAVPGWDEITAGWKDTSWCRYPETGSVTYSRWPAGADGSIPPSRLVSVLPDARESWRPETKAPSVHRTTPHTLPSTYELGHPPIPTFR